MEDPLKILQDAISETERLTKFINRKKSTQVRTEEERQIIVATVYTWTNNHRPVFSVWDTEPLLHSIDERYSSLLEYSAKDTSRKKYKKTLRGLKTNLINFRSAIFSDSKAKTNGRAISMPDFSPLVSDKQMRSILHRRWNEIVNCLNNDSAPLSATIMMSGVLEALFIARINKLTDKRPIFKLKTAPKDKAGKTLSFSDWTLNDYIEVANEMSWIRKPARDIGKVMRDYRNLIHPERELRSGIVIEAEDAQMFFPIFTQLTNQIVSSVK